ncbi:MAG: hypothetical protein IT245_00825 [Bacteroidia bacterium]|nr:hypothetical protein [Bacteroidia bacterium]
MKHLIKSELLKGKLEENLVTFSDKDLLKAEWEHAKEFFLDDEKYDVIRVVASENGLIYYCVNDKKELALINSMNKQSKQSNILDDVLKMVLVNANHLTVIFDNKHVSKNSNCLVWNNFYVFDFTRFNFKPPLSNLKLV